MSQTIVGDLAVQLGIADDQLRAGLAQAVVQAQQAGQKMQAAVNQGSGKATSSAANMNMAILQASRGIQDFQAAGLNGMINNVEGIASAFGVGAGVAGAVTLAAVAIQSLSPAISSVIQESRKLFGVWESESEKASRTVAANMGAGGASSAKVEVLKNEIEFLKSRNSFSDVSLASPTRIGGAVELLKTGFNSNFKDFRDSDEVFAAMQERRAIEATAKLYEAMRYSNEAATALVAAQRAAAAKQDLTTNQQGETQLNKQLFQSAVDKYNGGENLRTKIEQAGIQNGMLKTDANDLYGKFAAGDIAATKQVESMIPLGDERAKIQGKAIDENMNSLAEQFKKEQAIRDKAIEDESRAMEDNMNNLKALFQNEEKVRVENAKSLEDNMNYLKGVAKRRDKLEEQAGDVKDRISGLMDQRARSEVVSASSVFEKNISAGMEDPVVKAIEKQTEELKQINRELATLG